MVLGAGTLGNVAVTGIVNDTAVHMDENLMVAHGVLTEHSHDFIVLHVKGVTLGSVKG